MSLASRGLLYFVGGATYPIWYLLSPADARGNSFWSWIVVGASFVVVGALTRGVAPANAARWAYAPTFLATAHLLALATLNQQSSFFAVAAVMIVLSAIPLMRDRWVLGAYSGCVLVLCAAQFVYGAGGTAFLAVGVAWMTVLSGGWARVQADTADRLRRTKDELAHERSERLRLENELRTAQRMDALGRLAGAFAHEFNNQLMAIRIHTELLEKSIPSGAPQRADLDQIHNTTSAAADLTARLLTFSRPSREQEDPADVPAIVRQNLVTLRHLMTEHVPLSWRLPDRVHRAPVGAKQLSQVLLNLALNAKEAMSGSGTLRIEVTRIPRSQALLPAAITSETLIVLTVSDTGPGMDEETRERIFEPFFTTKADRGNTGLGLSVVYGIVRETGGHIRVTSEPGRGARFDIYWPEVGEAAAVADVAAKSAPEAPRKRARVLLVEDQAVLRVGLTRWLADCGYAVVACESGEEALTRANDVDVIASDVVLRGMDGIELLGRIRRAAPRLPAVLFSGHLDHLARERREIPPGVAFLEKPFAPEALVSKLDELVDAARATRVH
jgi:signal transduction histidine kinase